MPRPNRHSQASLLLLLLFLLGTGFLTTALLSYYASRDSIRDSIINTELPLTSDTVYSEIQKDMVRPILISSMMARDTFLRDWVLAGEQDTAQITRYLREVQEHYGAFTSFFVSDKTSTYYQAKGVLKQVKPDEERDIWYYRVRELQEPYEINVDVDMANADRLTIFINYKVHDYEGTFIGTTGVGLAVDAMVKLIDEYQQRYERSVYFVDTEGRITLTGAQGGPLGAKVGESLADVPGLNGLMEKLPTPQSGRFEYQEQGHEHFLHVRYIPELEWYLFVDKQDKALAGIRQGLYINLLLYLLVTTIVLTLVGLVLRRYQQRIAMLATTDSLTELPNRRGFDILAEQALQEAQRDSSPLYAVLLDLDNFKQINDQHGHLAGDDVLRRFARQLRDTLRKSDILCRWGGEEFILLLKNSDRQAAYDLAEKLRQHCAEQRYTVDGQGLRVTVSLGLSQWHVGESLHTLLGRTDRALYRAKQGGRDSVCLDL